MEWSRARTLQLIHSVKGREALWDPKNPYYFIKAVKEDAWKEISKELDVPVEECRRKFKTILAGLRREKMRLRNGIKGKQGGEEAKQASQWYAFEHLTFLLRDKSGVDFPTQDESEDFHYDDAASHERSPPSTPTPAKRVKVEEDSEREEVPESSTQRLLEECDSFGAFVSSKLKNYPSSLRSAVQETIANALFSADRGDYPYGVQDHYLSTR